MKPFLKLFSLTFAFLILFGGVNAQATGATKIGIINSEAFFDEKTGVTKLLTALKGLETQFAPARKELEGMQARLTTLRQEIEKAPPTDAARQSKVEEYSRIESDAKRKAEDAQRLLEQRRTAVLTPVQALMGTALRDFVKARGLTVIFDAAKDQNGFLLAVGDQGVDVTADFIAFFNARP